MSIYVCRSCNYTDAVLWEGTCPQCKGFYRAKPIGSQRNEQRLIATTAASSSETQYKWEYIPTGLDAVDECLSGGVVRSQSILLAGPPGCRKSTIGLEILNGLTKRRKDRYQLYVSAEQDAAGVMDICNLNGIKSDKIVFHTNDAYVNSIDRILERCDQLNPFATVFDSLQPIAELSDINVTRVTRKIVDYCKKTKMIGIIICQVNNDTNFKGGNGPQYYVDTPVMIEPFKRTLDGDPVELFGAKVAREVIGFDRAMRARDFIDQLRVMVGGAFGKNRYGKIDKRVYILTAETGELLHLKPLSKEEREET